MTLPETVYSIRKKCCDINLIQSQPIFLFTLYLLTYQTKSDSFVENHSKEDAL